MSELKKGLAVKARTVRGDKFNPGTIADVKNGPKGAWYQVKMADGSTITTRAACIQPA